MTAIYYLSDLGNIKSSVAGGHETAKQAITENFQENEKMRIAYLPSSILVWILFCEFYVHLCVINCLDIFDLRLPLTLMFGCLCVNLGFCTSMRICLYLLCIFVCICCVPGVVFPDALSGELCGCH